MDVNFSLGIKDTCISSIDKTVTLDIKLICFGRIKEASSQPKREYQPKPRMSLDFTTGDNTQHNGGISHATTPKPAGNGSNNVRGEKPNLDEFFYNAEVLCFLLESSSLVRENENGDSIGELLELAIPIPPKDMVQLQNNILSEIFTSSGM